jgi:SPP1 family predicted phage head-tail adaptor
MRAGDLNHRMRIQSRVITVDSANGQQVESFTDAGIIWLGRKFGGGGESVAAGVERATQSLQFWAHYSDARNLTNKHRLIDDSGAYFNVQSVDSDSVRGMAVITAETGLNDG